MLAISFIESKASSRIEVLDKTDELVGFPPVAHPL
jgi:hypothetical protein